MGGIRRPVGVLSGLYTESIHSYIAELHSYIASVHSYTTELHSYIASSDSYTESSDTHALGGSLANDAFVEGTRAFGGSALGSLGHSFTSTSEQTNLMSNAVDVGTTLNKVVIVVVCYLRKITNAGTVTVRIRRDNATTGTIVASEVTASMAASSSAYVVLPIVDNNVATGAHTYYVSLQISTSGLNWVGGMASTVIEDSHALSGTYSPSSHSYTVETHSYTPSSDSYTIETHSYTSSSDSYTPSSDTHTCECQ